MLRVLAITLQSFVCVSAHLSCNFHPVGRAPECVRHCVLWARVMTERTRMRMPCHGIALHRKLHPMRPDTAAVTACQGHWSTITFLFAHPVKKNTCNQKTMWASQASAINYAVMDSWLSEGQWPPIQIGHPSRWNHTATHAKFESVRVQIGGPMRMKRRRRMVCLKTSTPQRDLSDCNLKAMLNTEESTRDWNSENIPDTENRHLY